VVVDRDREDLLRPFLPDHVVVEDRLDLGGLRHRVGTRRRFVLLYLLGDDVVAEGDALIADVNGRTCD
jgi:hypothetical protein